MTSSNRGVSELLFRFHCYCQIYTEGLWLEVKGKEWKGEVIVVVLNPLVFPGTWLLTSYGWSTSLKVKWLRFLLSIEEKKNPTSLLLATFVQSNLFREQLNIFLLLNIGTAHIPNHKAIYYAIPSFTTKSCISVSTSESGAFQLGGMAGGKDKSAFPFLDNILKLTVLLNTVHQPGG